MTTQDTEAIVVLRHATIIDGTGAEPVSDGTVIVEGQRIREVTAGDPGMLPPGAQVVDCHGRSLLPGLIDGHVHISAVEADLSEQQRRNYPSVLVIRTLQIMRDCLEQGFTTVRDCGGADPGFRIAVAQGLVPGPRLSMSGAALSMTGGHGDGRLPTEVFAPVDYPAGLSSAVADGVDACRKASREQLRRGVDFLKVMAGGGCMSPADEVDTSQYSPEELRAVVWGGAIRRHLRRGPLLLGPQHPQQRRGRHPHHRARQPDDRRGGRPPERGRDHPGADHGHLCHDIPHGPPVWACRSAMSRKYGKPAKRPRVPWPPPTRQGFTIASGSDLLGPMQVHKALELELQGPGHGDPWGPSWPPPAPMPSSSGGNMTWERLRPASWPT